MPSDFSQTSRICSFPATVCPGPNVAVAFGAYRLIIMSMSFFEIASWKVLSIWLIAYRSDCRRSSAPRTPSFALDPPQAESARTSTASTPPINSVRMCLCAPSGPQ